ncbi:protein kinase [Saccharomonospora sp. NPDC046836]|uniref:protein kinase domain-containing protein n=1 Tax=Saccharomonospora sp. NPDC046836 TaxID=3156921 RepID=UPI0033FC89CA
MAEPAEPNRRLPEGTIVDGRYQVLGPLARSGAAEVFRAQDRNLRRDVAMKLFCPSGSGSPRDRAEREAQLLARLNNPGVPAIYDVGAHDGLPYLVMQLVPGRPLPQLLAAEPIDGATIAMLGARVAGVLAHVHSRQVVHGDLRAANVVVGAAGAAWLLGFGKARLYDGAGGSEFAADVGTLGLLLSGCLEDQAIPGGAVRPLQRVLRDLTRPNPASRPDAGRCARLLVEAAARCSARDRRASRPVAPTGEKLARP